MRVGTKKGATNLDPETAPTQPSAEILGAFPQESSFKTVGLVPMWCTALEANWDHRLLGDDWEAASSLS